MRNRAEAPSPPVRFAPTPREETDPEVATLFVRDIEAIQAMLEPHLVPESPFKVAIDDMFNRLKDSYLENRMALFDRLNDALDRVLDYQAKSVIWSDRASALQVELLQKSAESASPSAGEHPIPLGGTGPSWGLDGVETYDAPPVLAARTSDPDAYCRWCGLPGTNAPAHTCHSCNEPHDPAVTFCPSCGSESRHPANKTTPPPSPPPTPKAAPIEEAQEPDQPKPQGKPGRPKGTYRPKKPKTAKSNPKGAQQEYMNLSVSLPMSDIKTLGQIAKAKGMSRTNMLQGPAREIAEGASLLAPVTLAAGAKRKNCTFRVRRDLMPDIRKRCTDADRPVCCVMRSVLYAMIGDRNLDKAIASNAATAKRTSP